jgi:hypothetical protein
MEGLSKIEIVAAFVLGFGAGVSGLVFLGSEIAKELRSAKHEVAGTIERLAQAIEQREVEAKH